MNQSPIDVDRFADLTSPPKENRGEWTDIIFILDQSGSMMEIRDTAMKGFNQFLTDQQKEPGYAAFTLVLFNDTYIIPYNGTPIKDVKPINTELYTPKDGTALRDAIGRAITETKARIANMAKEDRPAKVLFAILTDGEENTSREYKPEQVKTMINAQEEAGWAFMYLAADKKALDVGLALGIDQRTSFQYQGTAGGTQQAFDASSWVASSVRNSKGLSSQAVMRNLSANVKDRLTATPEDASLVEKAVGVVLGRKP